MTEYPSCEKIAEISIEKFTNLIKNIENDVEQWSILSTIIEYNQKSKECKVVALGTGTKCIGVDKMCPNGTILNDSHAEIICRRSFLRYIYSEMLKNNEIFQFDKTKCYFSLNPDITYHFFSTHPPCGDATITENNDEAVASKKTKLDSDYVCTGAKILGIIKGYNSITGEKNDPLNQEEGALRTKPGRGVRTLSMSCSDKLSKWNILGVQGALLDLLLKDPIYFKTLNFCYEIHVMESIKRAIYNRWKIKKFINDRYILQEPDIRINCDTIFYLTKLDDKKPSPRSIAWCNTPENEKPLENAINGKKQGITKKALEKSPLCGVLQISKFMLSKKFIEVVNHYPTIKDKILRKIGESKLQLSYKELKILSECYQNAWNSLKTDFFGSWTEKPEDLLNFKVKL
ncbi:tRNA-specific adenosine deaminase 1 [Condylostylus longicornis]|uniref:tRNA-specific adenosine deaminase 1 n=1 Tax=Condylostylus longicornis TaxID=2530218 RepID=UPI00244E27CD|nr:tRNA-specific adenosine deaminase 1 [Condylostylus longicornis]